MAEQQQFQKLMMVKELSEALHKYDETLTDPVAKEKARAYSLLILEGLIKEADEEQATEENKKNEEEIARLAAQHETILRRLFESATSLPHTTESKKEEVASPSTQPEDRATAFITDEPDDDKPKQQALPQKSPELDERIHAVLMKAVLRAGDGAILSETTTDEEGRPIPVFHMRVGCPQPMADYNSHASRHASWYQYYRSHQHHQEAPETDNPDVNLVIWSSQPTK